MADAGLLLHSLSAALKADPSLNASASVALAARSPPIVADLGGALRHIPYTSHLPLNASVLSGGDSTKPFSYSWSCFNGSDSSACTLSDFLANQTSSEVIIDSSLLIAGEPVSVSVTVSQPGA